MLVWAIRHAAGSLAFVEMAHGFIGPHDLLLVLCDRLLEGEMEGCEIGGNN